MELHEEITRIKSIMGLKLEIINEDPIKMKRNTPSSGWCTSEETKVYDNLVNTVYPPLLASSIKWWNDWLSSPITKEKFIKNNKGNLKDPKTEADEIFKGYFNILSQIKLVPYGVCKDGNPGSPNYAYVTDDKTNNIYVNTKHVDMDSQSLLEIFTHEVQHLLYFYYPLNPWEKVDNCYTVKTFKKGSLFQKLKNLLSSSTKQTEPTSESGNTINNITTSFGIPIESSTKVYNEINGEIEKQKKWGYEDYISDPNENLSRITGVRQRLNIVPGTDITTNDFKPYIDGLINSQNSDEYFTKLNKDSLNFYWLLLYWGYKGFADFNGLLSSMNQLAQQKNKSVTDNVA